MSATLTVFAAMLVPALAYGQGSGKPLEPPTATVLETASGVRFGVWPDAPPERRPTLFILAASLEETLNSAYFRQCGNQVAARGYLCVSVDLPGHGRECRPGEPAGLGAWRRRCELGEDFVAELTSRLRLVLDDLVQRGRTDPERVAACGTSRGAFAALHFAAAEPRVKQVAAFAPLIDMAVLSEFKGAEENPLVRRLDLRTKVDALTGRSVWLIVGDRDARVDTDLTIEFARRLTRASLRNNQPAQVDLHVLAEPKGHTTPAGAAQMAADWLEAQGQHSR